MNGMDRTRSPHVKLQEFVDCFLETNHKKELEDFSSPRLARPTREDLPGEALRYLAILLLYGLSEGAKDISLIRKEPDKALCRMSGDKFYDIPAPKEEVVVSLFDEIEEMAGISATKTDGKLILGLKDGEIELKISSTLTDAGEGKILIRLPGLA